MIDIDEYARRAVESPIAEPPGMATVTARAMRQRRNRTVVRTASALALVGVIGLGAVAFASGRDRASHLDVRSPGRNVDPGPTSIPTTSTARPANTPSTTRTTTSLSVLQNLPTDDSVKAALVVAFAEGQRIDASYVAGTDVGSVYYAYEPGTHTFWALADFYASDAGQRAHERLDGTVDDPFIQFQDGPFVFSRTDASAWKLLGDTGGLVCPPRPPAAVLALWSIGGGADCP